MLLLLLTIFSILPILVGIGLMLERGFGRLWCGVSAVFFMGIIGLSLCWTLLSFFIPLGNWVEIISGILGWIFFIYYKGYRLLWRALKGQWLFFGITLMIILFLGSGFPFIFDHFGYYVPTIQWLSQVGLVKGISNLDLVLGQMSVWHIFQTGFSHFLDPYLRINSVVLVGYLLYIIEKKAWEHCLFIPFLFFFIQSPSPDLMVIIGALILVNEVLHKNPNTANLWLFSTFIFALKPTALWLPIMIALYTLCFNAKLGWKHLGGALVLGIFFFKNIWCFGYPIFPVQVMDFNVPWKPNALLLKESSEIAILKTYDFQYTYQEIQHFSVWEYLKNWLTLEGIKGKINGLFVLCLLALCLLAGVKKSKLIAIIVGSILVKSVLVLVFSAQYRFFLEVFFVGFLLLMQPWLTKKRSLLGFALMSGLILPLFCFPKLLSNAVPSFSVGAFIGRTQTSQILCPSVYQSTDYQSFTLGNLSFNTPKHYPFSYQTPLPSISPDALDDYLSAGIFPQKQDSLLKQGFIWKPLSTEEKQQLKAIISEIQKP